jgi:hypothetical protein
MRPVRYWTDVRLWGRRRRFPAGESQFQDMEPRADSYVDRQRFMPPRRTTIPPLPRIYRYSNSRVDRAQRHHPRNTTSARSRCSRTLTTHKRNSTPNSLNRHRIINPTLLAILPQSRHYTPVRAMRRWIPRPGTRGHRRWCSRFHSRMRMFHRRIWGRGGVYN